MRKLAAKARIEIKTPVAKLRQGAREMLWPLHPRVPVVHGKKKNVGLAGARRQRPRERGFRIRPAVFPLLGFSLWMKRKIKPLQIEGADAFLDGRIGQRAHQFGACGQACASDADRG